MARGHGQRWHRALRTVPKSLLVAVRTCRFPDQKDPQGLLRSLHRALRAGGVYLMQDIGGSAHLENNLGFPMASLLYAISCVHCTPISLGQGGAGLGTMWGWETAQRMLREAGFDTVERHVLPHDPMNVWFVSRKEGLS